MDNNQIFLRLIESEKSFNNCYNYNTSLKKLYNLKTEESDNIIRDTIIAHYKSIGYRYLNEILLNCKNDNNEYINDYTYLLNKVLDELPKYQDKVVYRWDNTPEDGTKFLIEKRPKFIQIPQYWSTSKICKPERNQFIVKTSNNTSAYDVSHISENKFEDEVLFKPNSIFSVKDISNKIIYLDEIDYNIKQESVFLMKYNFWILN
jgi:hypothetical protein